MRLSDYLQDTETFQDSLEIVLFHGTHSGHRQSFEEGIGIPEIVIPERDISTDFGHGFYMTGFAWQAIAWAKKRAKFDGHPILIAAKVKLKKLRRIEPSRTLLIDEYNDAWASTIRAGRSGVKLPYDWICGRCADNQLVQVAASTWPSDDIELARRLMPRENTQAHHYEQIWFGNEQVIKACLTEPFIMDLKAK